jgi:DNA invertase Pin-like site-specific DNA recombinase
MDDNNARQQVFGLLNTIHENNYGHLFREVNREELRYAIYLRKSSDEKSDKQLKSIGDQLLDIKEKVLEPNKITNYQIIKEEHSAKTSDTRTKFNNMLTGLWSGEYDGLIAWHPDRLARNMKEAGEIIDMLDRFVIQDLLFATASYENNANGKMMLGISFALSKQYAEHLGESVLRGYGRRIGEGIYLGKMVHGYKILKDGFLEPDGKNFLIIQEAFQKRLQSKPESLNDIAKWLNKQDYTQCYGRKQERSRTRFNDKKLSELFRESIYAGYLQYGVAKPVDLVELIDFEPMISAEEFLKLNNLDSLDKIVTRGVVTQNKFVTLLPGRIICGHCKSNMHVNTGTGKTKKKTYVYFRCDNTECPFRLDSPKNPRHNKHSIRANVVTNAAVETLGAAQFDLKKAYANYIAEQKKAVEREQIDLISQERRIRADRQQTEANLERAKSVIADPTKADVAEYYKADIKKYIEVELPSYEKDLAEVKRQQANLKQSKMSEEKFLKLIENAVNYIGELKDLGQLNEILEMFYSNFIILDKAVSVITFNQEWYDVLNPAWLGMRDSNPRSRDQNPLPYHLANPQYRGRL